MEIKPALNTIGKPMHTADGSVAYQYEDDEQARLVFDVWNLTGWEMLGFDQWTNHPTAWKVHPQKLAHLFEQGLPNSLPMIGGVNV